MNEMSENIQQVLDEADLLCGHAELTEAIHRMAKDINNRLKNKQVLCLSVMLGGLIPAGQLLPHLNMLLELDYIQATRYHRTTQGTELHWLKYPDSSLQGKTVLIIDDILDQGLTLQAIVNYCKKSGAKEVLTAVLVEKQLENRQGLQQADFTGIYMPNRYLFGYGMDYHGQLRHVSGIYAVKGL